MNTVRLNKYQEAALRRLEAAYIGLIDAHVSLIAYRPEDGNIGLYAYSCEDLEKPIAIEKEDSSSSEMLEEEGYEPVEYDLTKVIFDVEGIMFEEGYKPYVKFKEEE